MRRSGLALLLIVGVLGILSVLGTAFVVLSRLERRASAQRLHGTKALLLSRSGFEDAAARLSSGQDIGLAPNRYGGENWDGDAAGLLNGSESAEQVYNPTAPGTKADVEACPVRHAMRPSFFARILPSNPDPARMPVGGRSRGYSGRLAGDRDTAGNQYVLRVVPDEGIWINGGDLTAAGEGAPGASYNTPLKRVLGNLAEALGLPRAAGEALVTARPAGGWKDLSQADPALRPYLTVRAWADRKVIRPNLTGVPALPAIFPPNPFDPPARGPRAWGEWKAGRSDAAPPDPSSWSGLRAFNTATGSYAPDFERDALGRIVGRAPVNLNWAKDKPPVLKALLQGLKGVYIDEATRSASHGGFPLPAGAMERAGKAGWLGDFATVELTLTSEIDAVVAAIGSHSGFLAGDQYPDWDGTPAFDSWDEFNLFVERRLGFLSGAQRDLLKAHFNPNSDLNKFNPGRTLFRRVDKSDLLAYSTEFSFGTPCLLCTSLGRVLDSRGEILAQRETAAPVRFGVLRLTAQSEFCAADQGRLEVAGDESAFRLPGTAGFISSGTEPDAAFGTKLLGGGGQTLQSYPEPQWPAAGGPCPVPAAYDGRLELGSVELAAGAPSVRFMASWDRGYDASLAAPGKAACLPDFALPTAPTALALYGSAAGSSLGGTVLPDGCYSERGRVPGFLCADNLPQYRGLVSTWYKPNFEPAAPPRARYPLLFNLSLLANNPPPGAFAFAGVNFRSQVIALGGWGGYAGTSWTWGLHVESRAENTLGGQEAVNGGGEGGVSRPDPFAARRWILVTGQWNLQEAALWSPNARRLFLNATEASDPYFDQANMGLPGGALAEDATRDAYRTDNTLGPNAFYLGFRGWTLLMNLNSVCEADGTFDEFVVMDPGTVNLSANVAGQRYRSGRCYKGDDASWLSGILALPAGTRLTRVGWTLGLPRYDPADASDPARAFFGAPGNPASPVGAADLEVTATDPGGSGIPLSGTVPAGGLRLRALLRPRLLARGWNKLNTPLLESPWLDDLTLHYVPPGGILPEGWVESS